MILRLAHGFKEYADGVVVNGAPVRLELMGQEGTLNLPMGGVNYLKVRAVYSDGSTRMVTAEADISSSNSSVLAVERAGKLVGVAPGNATVTINYQHPVTRASGTLTLAVTVLHPFSLTKEAFDPSIWEKGSFDENTRTLITRVVPLFASLTKIIIGRIPRPTISVHHVRLQ